MIRNPHLKQIVKDKIRILNSKFPSKSQFDGDFEGEMHFLTDFGVKPSGEKIKNYG